MNSFDRRKFIKSVLYGVGLTTLGNIPAQLLASATEDTRKGKHKNDFSEEFRKAREMFFKKEYDKAEHLYKNILSHIPADISVYDNYKKVLNTGHRTEEILPYYRKALEKYPARVDFQDRIAKTFREIAMGNRKLEEKLALTEASDLLQASAACYKEAIRKDSGKKYLYFGLLDTLDAIDRRQKSSGLVRIALNASPVPSMSEEEAELTGPYLQEWMVRKHPGLMVNARTFAPDSVGGDAEARLQRILEKDRRQLYFPKEQESRSRELVRITKKLKTESYRQCYERRDLPQMVALTEELLQADTSETHLLGATRKSLKKEGRWDLMLKMYQKRAVQHKDFWTQYGLGNAYVRTGKADMGKAAFERLGQSLKYPSGKKIDVVYRGLCECALSGGDITAAKEHLLKGMDLLGGMGGASLTLLLKYAECLAKEQDYETAEQLLRKKLDSSYLAATSDAMLKYIAPDLQTAPELYYRQQVEAKYGTMGKEDRISVLCAIAKLQKEGGDMNGVSDTCREIASLQAGHPFIKNIQS